MRIPLLTILVLATFGASVSFVPSALSQDADPFGGDPFGGSFDGGDGPSALPAATAPNVGTLHSSDKPAIKTERGTSNRIYVANVNQAESEMRIRATLSDETSSRFIDTPLVEAIQAISSMHNIPIVVDRRALEEIGLSHDTPVNIELKNVSLLSFLRLMLRDLDLTYMIKDEVLQITTVESAEQNLATRMYRIPNELVPKADQIMLAMQSAVVPGTWNTTGGPSTAVSIDHVLIVSTTSDVHHQVENFLNTLIETHER